MNLPPGLAVMAAFGHTPYDTATAWTDITPYTHQFDISRGSTPAPTPNVVAGVLTLEMDNTSGRFDPNNTASPYSPDVVLGTPIVVQVWIDLFGYGLFRGFIDSIGLLYPDAAFRSVATITCVDGLQLLNQYSLDAVTYPAQSVSARVNAVLDDAGWPAAWRNVDTGVADVAALTDGTGLSALEHLGDVVDAEAGSLFINDTGYVVFHSRVKHSAGGSETAVFGPDDLKTGDVIPRYDSGFLYNVVDVSVSDGSTVSVSDSVSITNYRERTLSIDGAAMSANTALNVAEWTLEKYKDVELRVESLTVYPARDSTWLEITRLDLNDSVRVIVEPPSGDTLSQLVSIYGIRHTVTPSEWVTRFECFPLSDIETSAFWVLGTSQLGPVNSVNWIMGKGRLDTDTVLAASLLGPPTVLA